MSNSDKTVLILGSGLVSPPLIKYLSAHGFNVIVANRTLSNAQKIVNGVGNATAVQIDVETPEGVKLLDEYVPKCDAVVSMLPYLFHLVAAKAAMKYKKHFFTTSYTTDAMRALDAEAKQAGVIIVNECGVDPGTDHMSAMRAVHAAKAKGGECISFTSFCGGLPAPDNNDNPFGYKFSWAPRGVLLASRNDAHFLKDGKDVSIDGKDLFDNFEVVEIPGVGTFEAYPNRNSKQYIDVYNLPKTQTMIRGTYRYKGWCPTVKKIADLGYLDLSAQVFDHKTMADLTREKADATDAMTASELKTRVAKKLGLDVNDYRINNMEWLGLFSDQPVPKGVDTFLDALCHVCKEKMQYKAGERDMLVMRHEMVFDYPDRKEFVTCTMVDYGIPNGDSSMSRTVSIPVAIAVRLVLEGKTTLTGIQIPTIPELYNPILDELETLNIKYVEKVEKVEKK